MRLWSLHPKYLDQKGLGALWREALLAQAVLNGKTKGYKNHPQLERFKACAGPLAAMCDYLVNVYGEARSRGYSYDWKKIAHINDYGRWKSGIPVTTGQMAYETEWLAQKIEKRTGARLEALTIGYMIHDPHPLFYVVPGPIEPWEKVK